MRKTLNYAADETISAFKYRTLPLTHRQGEISQKYKKSFAKKNSPKKGMSRNAKSEHFT